jgi:hypothetical protein
MLAAIDASKAYYERVADLESAHIRHDIDSFGLKQRVADALKTRDGAMKELNDHEHTHKNRAVG